jgi:hypothetical protein
MEVHITGLKKTNMCPYILLKKLKKKKKTLEL